MFYLIVTVSDSSYNYNGRNGTRAVVSAGFTICPAYLINLGNFIHNYVALHNAVSIHW